jgi:hypothetical protein
MTEENLIEKAVLRQKLNDAREFGTIRKDDSPEDNDFDI